MEILILSVYLSLLALHLSGTPSLKTGTCPPSCHAIMASLDLSAAFDTVNIYAVVWCRSNVPISKMSSFKMNPDFGCVLF